MNVIVNAVSVWISLTTDYVQVREAMEIEMDIQEIKCICFWLNLIYMENSTSKTVTPFCYLYVRY